MTDAEMSAGTFSAEPETEALNTAEYGPIEAQEAMETGLCETEKVEHAAAAGAEPAAITYMNTQETLLGPNVTEQMAYAEYMSTNLSQNVLNTAVTEYATAGAQSRVTYEIHNEPKVSVEFGDVRETADVNEVLHRITSMLREEMACSCEGVY